MGVLIKIWYVLLFILVVGLLFYDNVCGTEYKVSVRGIERERQLFGRITNISEDHFYLDTGTSNFRIESSNVPIVRKARYGETVVHVVYIEGGIAEGIDYHNYDYNYLLYFISFVAFIIFLIIFFREWRFTLRRKYLFDNKYSRPPHNYQN